MSEVKKVNLRAELLAAEAESRAKKRKAAGLPVEDVSPVVPVAAIEDEESKKRRKVLQDALEMDKDADSDEDDDADADMDVDGPKGGETKYVACSVSLFFLQIAAYAYVLGYSHRTAETMPRAVKMGMMMVRVVRVRLRMRMRMRTRMKRTRQRSCSGNWRR